MKVFSKKKFRKWLFKMDSNMNQKEYNRLYANKKCEHLWVKQCDGKTEEEINRLGYATANEWMEEKK